MSKQLPNSSSLPPGIQRVSRTLKWTGLIGFWLQLITGVVSGVFLVIAAASNILAPKQATQGTEFGIFFAICALICLGVSIYFYYRYTQIGDLLRNPNAAARPKKTDTLKLIKLGRIVNITGTALSIVGTQSVVGVILLFKAVVQNPFLGLGTTNQNATTLVLPADMFNIAANTATVTAHFTGLLITLWLIDRIEHNN
ncbi:MAG: DUF3611 family protein [Prochloraceae cyanobacterium]|nr:DUF3611 family protein [Prochloraceae cyanobacterium]